MALTSGYAGAVVFCNCTAIYFEISINGSFPMIFQNIPAIQVALPVNSTGIDKRASPVDIDLPLYFKHSTIFKVAIYTHIRIYLQRTTYFQGASVKIQIIGGIGLPGQNTVDPVVSIQIQITATA